MTVHFGQVEPIDVHFDDLDSMGLVHNARYAVLFERVLNTFWTRHGYTFRDGGYSRPDACVAVAEFAITYRVPVRGTGPVRFHFWVDRLGETSATYAFRVLSPDGSTVHAEGRRVHIRLDERTLRPTAWTAECRAILDGLRGPDKPDPAPE